jgi:cytochrome b involved in lipid metabolism
MAAVNWNDRQPQLPWRGEISEDEVAKHNSDTDCWVIIDGKVYDVTSFLSAHPTGPGCILELAGRDMTEAFKRAHSYLSPSVISKVCIGTVKL